MSMLWLWVEKYLKVFLCMDLLCSLGYCTPAVFVKAILQGQQILSLILNVVDTFFLFLG